MICLIAVLSLEKMASFFIRVKTVFRIIEGDIFYPSRN